MASQLNDPANAFVSWGWNEDCILLLERLINHTISETDFISACRPKAQLTPETIVLAVVLVLLLLGTAGGNMLVIIAILIVKKLRSPTNLLIVNLAVTDFLVSILVLPFAIAYQILGYWPFNQIICDLYSLWDVLLCTLSILSLCAICIDRYLAITKPLQYAAKRTPKRMLVMILISWLLSAAISIPPVFGWEKTKSPFYCGYSEELAYQIYATMTAFYIPLTVMLVLYGKIFVLAKQMAVTDAQMNTHRSSFDTQVGTSSIPDYSDCNRNSLFPQDVTYSPVGPFAEAIQENGRDYCGSDNANSLQPSLVNFKTTPVRLRQEGRFAVARRHKACSMFTFPSRSSKNFIVNGRSSEPGASKDFHGLSKPTLRFLRRRRENSQSSRHQKSETHKAVTTLGFIMGCFTICWLPFFVSQLITPIINRFSETKFSIPPTLFQVFVWLGYGNSFLNPIIYALFNREFRMPFLYILRFQCTHINSRLRTESFAHQFGIPPRNSVGQRHSSARGSSNRPHSRRPRRHLPRRISPLVAINAHAAPSAVPTSFTEPAKPPTMVEVDKTVEQESAIPSCTPPRLVSPNKHTTHSATLSSIGIVSEVE